MICLSTGEICCKVFGDKLLGGLGLIQIQDLIGPSFEHLKSTLYVHSSQNYLKVWERQTVCNNDKNSILASIKRQLGTKINRRVDKITRQTVEDLIVLK